MIKRSYKSNNPFNDHDHCEFCMAKFGKGNDELKQGSLRLDSDIYYEIVPLIEGAFAKRDFIILSNSTFESFRKHKASGLAQVCKTIEERGNQIIMPYSDRYISGLTDIPAWHKIG